MLEVIGKGADILPDSRTTVLRNSAWSDQFGCYIVPAFCANCGRRWGWVAENGPNCFVLCQGCEKWGGIAYMMKEPQRVYWERMAAEQEQARRVNPDLVTWKWMREQLDNSMSPLSKLVRELDAKMRRMVA